MTKIGFMASHGGSGMRAVIEALSTHKKFQPVVFIGNNPNAGAFEIARSYSVPEFTLNAKTHPDPEQLDITICKTLQAHQVDLLLLSGYMKKMGPHTLAGFKNRILNIHPSLLPLYGGQGMYGDRVHQAVVQNKAHETGASVHIVTAQYDQGPILKQYKVPVAADDSYEMVREKVKAIEGELYVQTVQAVLDGEIILP